jgi:hypothetical protein
LFSNTLRLSSSLNVKDQMSLPHGIIGKMIAFLYYNFSLSLLPWMIEHKVLSNAFPIFQNMVNLYDIGFIIPSTQL